MIICLCPDLSQEIILSHRIDVLDCPALRARKMQMPFRIQVITLHSVTQLDHLNDTCLTKRIQRIFTQFCGMLTKLFFIAS